MSRDLAHAHLTRAITTTSAFEKFDAAWLAFTQLYQLERIPTQSNRDLDLIRRATKRLESTASLFVNQIVLRPLTVLEPPVVDEKIRETRGVADSSCHKALIERARQLASRDAGFDDLKQERVA